MMCDSVVQAQNGFLNSFLLLLVRHLLLVAMHLFLVAIPDGLQPNSDGLQLLAHQNIDFEKFEHGALMRSTLIWASSTILALAFTAWTSTCTSLALAAV